MAHIQTAKRPVKRWNGRRRNWVPNQTSASNAKAASAVTPVRILINPQADHVPPFIVTINDGGSHGDIQHQDARPVSSTVLTPRPSASRMHTDPSTMPTAPKGLASTVMPHRAAAATRLRARPYT